MNICYVCREYPPSLRGGGIASYLKEVATGMAERGHNVTVVCASDDTRIYSDQFEDKVRIIRLPGGDFVIPKVEKKTFFKSLRVAYRFFRYRRKIKDCIGQLGNIDIIEVAEFGAESTFLHKIDIPVVIRLHTPALLNHYTFGLFGITKRNFLYYWTLRRELSEMRHARYSTSCSTSLKTWGVKYARMQEDKVRVIYNPIDVEKWSIKGSIALPDNKTTTILFAGTICDWKGCGELAEAGFVLEKKLCNPFTIKFVGKTGNWSNRLQSRFENNRWFEMVGKVNREQLMDMYASADVVVFPSWWENMPMVCIEAMLQGALVIGSNSGGMSEIIEDGKNGFLIEPRDPKVLAEKIFEVLSLNDSEKMKIRQNAINRIENVFSTSTILSEMEDYYRFVIDDYNQK